MWTYGVNSEEWEFLGFYLWWQGSILYFSFESVVFVVNTEAAEPMARVPKMARWKFPWHVAFTAVPNVSFFCPTSIPILWRTCVHTHVSDCIETVYELPLLPNNTASETFLHKSGAVLSVDWVFIIGVRAWRWLGEYVTLDRTFYDLLFKQAVIAPPVTAIFSSTLLPSGRPLLEI